jgi:hypothetical protein
MTNLVIVAGVLAAVTLLLGAGFYRQKHKKDNRDNVIVEDAPMISNFFTNLVYSTPNNAIVVENNNATATNENYYLQPQTQKIIYDDNYSEITDDSAIYNLGSSQVERQYYDNIVSQNENTQELYDLAGSSENTPELYDLADNSENTYGLETSK